MRRSRARVRNERQAREVAQPAAGVVNRAERVRIARVLPEESDQEPPEGRSSARRGGFAARADLSNPKADAVSVPASKSLQIPANRIRQPALSLPKGFPPSSSSSSESWASPQSSRRSPVGIGRQRPPMKLLGKSVPVVLMEYASPWNFIAEFAPRKKWSG